MRKSRLAAILILTILVLGAVAAWAATASFTPPPVEGTIFAVVNADRSPGALTTTLRVDWGPFHRTVTRGNPYGNCSGVIAGFVLMVRHNKPDSNRFTLTTTGTIARAPYQGAPPPEVSHPCYKLEKMRAVY
ncbi:MAG TPA: hypothetical protein VGX68_07490 [Thermoanaerobaculia bacterium]|jgi:hypothetical protein|nr:hypothetical protein [Thermoanaerobaculia bacterium]